MTGRETSLKGPQGNERGVALLTTLLVLTLTSALAVGFVTVVSSDQRYRSIDRDRANALYAAHSGIEKLTADLGSLFLTNVAPSDEAIIALGDDPPVIDGITYVAPDGGLAYGIVAQGGAENGVISTGPYGGLMALKRTYELTSVARTTRGGEVHLKRRLESVAIPVFQFGMFSDVDLSFSAADVFDFGGRVHTNGNLFLAQGPTGAPSNHCNNNGEQTLWLRDKVTAVEEIVRQELSNGNPITESSTRRVCVSTAPNAFRRLAPTEGSVVGGPASAKNPSWPTLSLSTYNGYIRNGTTGARPLNLPLVTTGGANTDLVGRPAVGEDVTNPTLMGERLFSKVSLRILLSDTAADITNLPTVTAAPPVSLDGDWQVAPPDNGLGVYGPVSAALPPIARSPGGASVLTSGGTNANAAQINVQGAIPGELRPPTLTIHTAVPFTVNCRTRTNSQFTNCGALPSPVPAGTLVTANGGALQTQTTALANAGSQQFSVTNNSTAPFAPPPVVVNGMTVQCTGHNAAATRFEGCSGNTSAIPGGSTITSVALTPEGTGLIGGFIKIEMQDTAGVWQDVTMEILNFGIASRSLGSALAPNCADPNPNAIVRLQRLKDGGDADDPACNNAPSQHATDYWPNVLFDAREAVLRDAVPAGAQPRLGGVMHYVELDVRNLTRWFAGAAPYDTGSGVNAFSINGGYAVYFSDRRNNRNAAGNETGEYGWEDVVNPENADGAPNGVLDAGEDLNGNGVLDTYGQFPTYAGVHDSVVPGSMAPLDLVARPTTAIHALHAKANRAVLFRRALKLTRGGIVGGVNNISVDGLTVVAENPVYVQGNWNAGGPFANGDGHVPTAVIADTVTVLSNNWNDNRSFVGPYQANHASGRTRNDTYYRLAIISGKSRIFPRPGGTGATFGTDGGAHSFLRMLEGGAGTVHYRGSMATFFYSRQAVSPFKCCGPGGANGPVIYSVPVRAFAFDTDFLDPAKLPPLTPVFRDLNALGFTQEIRPGF